MASSKNHEYGQARLFVHVRPYINYRNVNLKLDIPPK